MADQAAAAKPADATQPAASGGGSVAADALKALQEQGAGKPAAAGAGDGKGNGADGQATPAGAATASKPADGADPAKKDPPTPATAAGEIKLTAPKDSGLSDDHVKGVAEFAKANGLTQAQAEKILERDAQGAAAQKAAAEQAQKQQVAVLAEAESKGRQAWAADPTYGGAKLQESNIDVARALSKAPPELQKFLSDHPMGRALGSDPVFLRFMADIGRNYMREDSGAGRSVVAATPPPAKSIDAMADTFYPQGQLASPRTAAAKG